MAKLTRQDILKLAKLSRLHLSEPEVEKFQSEIAAILEYVELLQSVDLSGVVPTSQVTGLTNVMRSDEVKDYGIHRDALLQNAPNLEDGQIRVKRMIG